MTKIPYTAGLFTALTLMLSVSIYTIRHIIKNKQVKVADFGLAFTTMFIILLASQAIVVTLTGINYLDFLSNLKQLDFFKNPINNFILSC